MGISDYLMKVQNDPIPFGYGGETLTPIEIDVESSRVQAFDFSNSTRRALEFYLVIETQEKALRLAAYQL